MKTIKIVSFIILSIIGIILCFVLVINILGYRSNVANGITGTEIKKIEMGMTLEQVISILGKPYEIETLAGLHNLTCQNPKPRLEMSIDEDTDIIYIIDSIFSDTFFCCEGNEEDIQSGKRVTLTYTKRFCLLKSLFAPYPMLWVHLDSNYCVNSVGAKRYPEDIHIYSLSWQTDETTLEEKPGEISLFINDGLFNKCFKK